MKSTPPKLDERSEQPYVGIRSAVPMSEFPRFIPQSIDELFGWLGQHAIEPAGAPFMRYHVIDMDGDMDVEVGIPVAQAVPAAGRVSAAALPAGRYASLVYTGVDHGIEGNGALLDWIAANHLVVDQWQAANGDAFASRYEVFLTGPAEDPDPANWDTEVAMKLANT